MGVGSGWRRSSWRRNDDDRHEGDPQAVDLEPRYGARPPWHGTQLQVNGPAVGDVEHTFRERWEDPTPFDHRNPLRIVLRHVTGQPRHPADLPPVRRDPAPTGPHTVQIIRTYPAKRLRYPFAPDGERSIGRAYCKAMRRARRLVYVEEQYLWGQEWADVMAGALRREPELHLIVVVPRFTARRGMVSRNAENIGRARVIQTLQDAGGSRAAFYDLENVHGTPIYMHAKVCVIDDVWLKVGSDNLNRRSWTHDSELSCAVLDETYDEREPVDPGGLGDHARVMPRETRLRLWREHLGRDDDADLIDPVAGFESWRAAATALDAWHEGGRHGARPPGHVRVHRPELPPERHQWWFHTVHQLFVDPDGRPRRLRRAEHV